jgi:PAS domain S-box-containing protein
LRKPAPGDEIDEVLRAGSASRTAGLQFRRLLQKLPAGAYTCDAEGLITYYNQHAEQLWGRAPRLNDPADRFCGSFKLFATDGTPITHDRCWMALALKTDSEYNRREIVVERPDGRRLTALAHANPIHDESGELIGAVNVLVDITERKRAEEELRRAELFARSTLNSLSANIAILDESGAILAANRAWHEFAASNDVPAAADVAEGANYLEVCDEATGEGSEVAAAYADGIRAVISGRREVFELEYPCHSPTEERWFVGRVTRFPNTHPPRIVVAHENITGRKLAEEEIRTRARQQAAVAELGRHALAEADLSAVVDEAVAMLAVTLDVEYCEVLELLPDGEALLLRAGVGWGEDLVRNATVGLDSQAGYALRSERPVLVEDLSAETRFGVPPLMRDRGVVSSMSVVISGRDGPFGVLGAHTAEERRAFTRDDFDFFQAVANVLATAVERKRAEAELGGIREAERRRIARDMHDEALQDLTYALAETQLVQGMSNDPRLDERLELAVEGLKRAGSGIRAAVFDLRLGKDGGSTFSEQLEALVELNRRYRPEREIELLVEEGLPPPGESKQAELLRIVQEALANVRRHSEARRVRVAVGVEGGRLWAEVSDDGRGFGPETPAGLGTRGMRERARVLGGDLEIRSTPGAGTTVRLEAAPKRDAGRPEEEARVLLVEDHASLRQAVAAVFDREPGFAVVGQAGSLAEARGMLEEADLAVVDLTLPDGHGEALIKEMREVNPRAQALVLSAYPDRAEVARAVESGAAGVLHKSAGVDEVVDAARRLMAGETLMPLEEVVEMLRFAGSRREKEHGARQAISRLTPREKEVLDAVAEGLDGKGISERLHISLRTERNHMASILAKFGVNSRLQALVFALRHGVVNVDRSSVPDANQNGL